jgi:hypothetical protein
MQPDMAERVAAALRNYGALKPQAIPVESDDDLADIATPHRLGYALGWIAASVIVRAYYREAGIDALPVYHPENGWDRFLLTRRVSCDLLADEPADSFGLLLLSDADAPILAQPDGTRRLALGPLYRTDPAHTTLLEQIAPPPLPAGDHTRCPHERGALYPALFEAVTALIVAHPGVIAAREVFVDDHQVDGAYHPLFLHTGGRVTGFTYRWLAVTYQGRTAFVWCHGQQVVHESEPGIWRSEPTYFTQDDPPAMEQALRTWLHLDGTSEPAPPISSPQ